MKSRNQAFTLVELLIAIAVIGSLISLLLPAIQFARESARQTTCLNNLRQVTLMDIATHDRDGRLPPTVKATHEENLDKHLEFRRCPSTPITDLSATSEAFGYCHSLRHEQPSGKRAGYYGVWLHGQFRKVIDGLSNTTLYFESSGGRSEYKGRQKTGKKRGGITTTFRHYPESQGLLISTTNNAGIWSKHYTGANISFCDGHAKLFNVETDPELLRALFTFRGSMRERQFLTDNRVR